MPPHTRWAWILYSPWIFVIGIKGIWAYVVSFIYSLFFSFTICILLIWNSASSLLYNCYKMTWNMIHTFQWLWIYFAWSFIMLSSKLFNFYIENFQCMQKYSTIINLHVSSIQFQQLLPMVSLISDIFSMLSPSIVLF